MPYLLEGDMALAVDPEAAPSTPTILVLEDDIHLRLLLADTLRDAGFRVIEASSSDDTLQHLRAFNDVRLVFADINVPGETDGLGLAEVIQKEFPAIRIILVSGYKKEPIPAGVLFMRKPFILSRVIAEIRTMLQIGKQA